MAEKDHTKLDHENFGFTPIPTFDGKDMNDGCAAIGDNFFVLETNQELLGMINKCAGNNFVSKNDVNELVESKYFLAKKLDNKIITNSKRAFGQELVLITHALDHYLTTLRLLVPVEASPRLVICNLDSEGSCVLKERRFIYLSDVRDIRAVSLDNLKKALLIYRKLIDAKSREPNRLLTSIYLFGFAQASDNLWGKVINTTAALESIFNTESHEVIHQVSERFALFIGNSHKKEIYSDMKKIYEMRSSLVHGQLLSSKKIIKNILLFDDIEPYYRRVILKIFEDDKLFRLYTVKKDANDNEQKIREYYTDLLFRK